MRTRFGIMRWGVLAAVLALPYLMARESPAASPDEGYGAISTPWKQFELLLSSNGKRIKAYGTNWTCSLPAGSYDILYVKLRAVDSNGDEWAMCSSKSLGSVEVKERMSTWLWIGPPFKARVKPSRTRVHPGETFYLDLEITDGDGRPYGAPRRGLEAKPGRGSDSRTGAGARSAHTSPCLAGAPDGGTRGECQGTHTER